MVSAGSEGSGNNGKGLKTGVLLINLGTPDSPAPSDVRKYLLEFLTDGRVIDYSWLPRNLLVRGVIVPFRYRSSARLYSEIWDKERGSPLMYHTEDLVKKVRQALPGNYIVEFAMRYRNPSIRSSLERLREQGVSEIVVLPLFPQYASSSTGTAIEEVMDVISGWQGMPYIRIISSFYDNERFIDAFEQNIRKCVPSDFDHIIFSYHGLPERHLKKSDISGTHCLAEGYSCCNEICMANSTCYRAHCYKTTALLASKLGLKTQDFTMSFQSRLGRDPWIRPYTTDVVAELAGKGVKRLLVACPAFVADCLETVHEIGVELRESFIEMGGEDLVLVESLNDSDQWVSAVKELITGS